MYLLTDEATLRCEHGTGTVEVTASQDLVRIRGHRVQVEIDPEKRPISGCSMYSPMTGIRPCKNTLAVQEGYSQLLRVEGRRICLDTVRGFTDGTPPGSVHYIVADPGQQLVSEHQ